MQKDDYRRTRRWELSTMCTLLPSAFSSKHFLGCVLVPEPVLSLTFRHFENLLVAEVFFASIVPQNVEAKASESVALDEYSLDAAPDLRRGFGMTLEGAIDNVKVGRIEKQAARSI